MDERQSLDIYNLFREIERKRAITNNKSKFKIGQRVRITNDVDELVRYLRKLNSNYRESIILAKAIAGKIMEVQNSEELYEDDGSKGMYITVEDGMGFWYLLPENFLKDLGKK